MNIHVFHRLRLPVAGRMLSLFLLCVLLMPTFAEVRAVQAAPLAQGGVQRIRFAPGATSATVEGNVSGGQVMRYALTALAGQLMTIQPVSQGVPIYVTLFEPSRAVLGSTLSGEEWSGRLPTTGDYTLAVYPAAYAANADFQLRVEITSGAQTPNPVPERVRFRPGTVSAQVTGYLPSATSKSYILGALAGQVMTVESWTSNGPFRFTVTEANGNPLGGGYQGERWSGTLPHTQDYRIVLQSPADAPAANYGLQITIVYAAPTLTPTPVPTATPVPTVTPNPPVAQRVRFPQGATNVTLTGYIDTYTPTRYVLRALRGQTMTLDLDTRYGNPTRVTVRTELGYILGDADRGESWTGYLPSTGDYYLDVQAPRENAGDTFSLWVEIR